MKAKYSTTLSVALCLAALSGHVRAADPAAPAAEPAVDASSGLQEIVVTAEKKSEAASKTPISLAVYGGEALQKNGVFSITDLQNVDPNLTVGQNNSGAAISLRGITTTDITSKGNQDIAYNVDGIFNGRGREQALPLFDIDHIEVLRGPQGTLYGHSATAGAINVITNKPTDEFGASASFDMGNFNTRRATGVLNMPLTSTLFVRVAANFNVRDGFYNPVLGDTEVIPSSVTPINDENNHTVRTSVLWKPSDDLSLLVTDTVGLIGGTGPNYGALFDRYRLGGSAALQVYYNPEVNDRDNDSFHNVNAELNANLGPVHMTYAGAYQFYNMHEMEGEDGDPTGSNSYLWRDTQATYATVSHEIRFSNAEPQQLEWVAGANYYREDLDDNDQNWATYEFASPANGCLVNAPNLLYGCNSPSPAIEGPTQHKSEGVFGQANYHVTDEWTATLGARYSHDSMYRHATIDGGGPQPTTCFPPNPCTAGVPDVGSESSSKVTWRVGLQDQFLPNQMVYGYVASGYKPGGFNDPLYGQTKTTPYDPEQLIAYELGYKGQVVPNVQFNSSVYYYDFQKYQVTAAQFFGFGLSGPIITVFTKVAPVTAYGWENEVHWKVTPNDQFDAALSLERAYYRSLNVGFISANPISFSGKSLDNVPRAAATLGYEHRFYVADGGFVSARLQSKVSSAYVESDLQGDGNIGTGTYNPVPAQYRQAAYTRSDFTLGYTTANGKYSVNGYVRNIENKLQLLSAPQPAGETYAATDPDAAYVYVTAPRTFGVHFDLKY